MILRCTAQRRGKLLSFLRRELAMSSGLIGRLKYQNCFFVDGEPAHTDRIVCAGETVTVIVREKAETRFAPEHTPITVLYEDDCILAVDKPAGVIMHPTFNRAEGTLLTQVLGYYARTGQDNAVHTVNRLDRDTFGVVLFAKNSHVHAKCYDLQLAGAFSKTYHAFCLGAPADEGVIDLPIARVDGGSLLRKIDASGKPSRTEYRVLERRGDLCRVELHPVTGRTHQLRLHCLAAGFPILGDVQYCTPESRAESERLGLSAQQLCAKTLALPHPMTGENLKIISKQDVFLPEKG